MLVGAVSRRSVNGKRSRTVCRIVHLEHYTRRVTSHLISVHRAGNSRDVFATTSRKAAAGLLDEGLAQTGSCKQRRRHGASCVSACAALRRLPAPASQTQQAHKSCSILIRRGDKVQSAAHGRTGHGEAVAVRRPFAQSFALGFRTLRVPGGAAT